MRVVQELGPVPETPYDDLAWFTVFVGLAGEEGTEAFGTWVATGSAVSRIEREKRKWCVVVDRFEPDVIDER